VSAGPQGAWPPGPACGNDNALCSGVTACASCLCGHTMWAVRRGGGTLKLRPEVCGLLTGPQAGEQRAALEDPGRARHPAPGQPLAVQLPRSCADGSGAPLLTAQMPCLLHLPEALGPSGPLLTVRPSWPTCQRHCP